MRNVMSLSPTKRYDEGAALITVLGLLVVFMMLGTAWMGFMMIEHQKSDWNIEGLQATHAAEGGVEAGIAAVRAAIAAGNAVDLANPITLNLPVYRETVTGDGRPELSDRRACMVRVRLLDEAAKVNINHAPPNVLREILSIDGEKAREIRSSLPRTDALPGEDAGQRRWFSSVDELVTRGFLTEDELTDELKDALTVYTVPDPDKAVAYMNVNSASARVLQALLDVTPEVAAQVAGAQPFADITELSAAAGKDPATFNVRPAPDALNTLPSELSFTSRCYRIVSTAELIDTEAAEAQNVLATATINAVACIGDDGTAQIMFWNESAGRDTAEPSEEVEPETPAAA